MKSLLRVSTAGNVDDGKSTLIGRLLMETGSVPTDVADSIRKSTAKDFPGGFDYSLITDGLSSEQEQKITIDVAYRYFSTARRQYILADTPGHLQYTRNMATGASTANLAIVLIDAAKGMTSQSRRHAIISSLLGINHIIVAINKMDLVDYAQERFSEIREEFTKFSSRLNVKDVRFLPVSALLGDNVTAKSARMPWFTGETLSETLDEVYTAGDANRIDFRLPIQRVIRATDKFRGYAGQVASGIVRVGDPLVVLPSGFEVSVTGILAAGKPVDEAAINQSVTLTLDRELDISRGDVLAPRGNLPTVGSDFEANLIWFDEEPLKADQTYLIKHGSQWDKVRVEALRYKINVTNLRKSSAKGMELNDIGRVALRSFRPLVYDAYAKNRAMGNFILVDPVTSRTAAAGMILDRKHHTRTRGLNSATKEFQPVPKTILFTGLSGAGKSTLAGRVCEALKQSGTPVKWLDGDLMRKGVSSDLGFSPADRRENLRRMAEVAKLFNQEGIQVLSSFIAPLESDRELIRNTVGEGSYLEIFVNAPVAVCRERDPKGWYKKSDTGQVVNFTGVDSVFEVPTRPHLVVNTSEATVNQCVDDILGLLVKTRISGL